MTLIVWYVALVIIGDLAAYFLGLGVEWVWGPHVSLIVFLALYFLSLWVAWLIAVWLTAPKSAESPSSA